MGTKNNPAPFDCYANAEPNEPMFILLARDLAAPEAVTAWCAERVRLGLNEPNDAQLTEALDCAEAMEAWRAANRHHPHDQRVHLQGIDVANCPRGIVRCHAYESDTGALFCAAADCPHLAGSGHGVPGETP